MSKNVLLCCAVNLQFFGRRPSQASTTIVGVINSLCKALDKLQQHEADCSWRSYHVNGRE